MPFVSARSIALVHGFASLVTHGCAQPLPSLDTETTETTQTTQTEASDGTLSSTGASGPTATDAGTSDGLDDSTADTSPEPGCGNGILEEGETCDGRDLAGAACEDMGFDGGMLACDAECSYDTTGCGYLPDAPVLSLGLSPIKQFEFGWSAVADAQHYRLLESPAPGAPLVQIGEDLVGEAVSLTMPLHLRSDASYVLSACNVAGCTDSAPVSPVGSLAEAIGYVKASNTGAYDRFGDAVALSSDGTTLVVGAHQESSGATVIGGNQADDSASGAGAVYVLVRDAAGQWSQQAYIKPANTDAGDSFGSRLALSSDGATLAVGAPNEDSAATTVDGNAADDSATDAGAAYVFVRNAMGQWTQQAYVKASNAGSEDYFGDAVGLSGDGDTLVVGARYEDGGATGIGGPSSEGAPNAGAAYVFARDGAGQWSQQAYVKATNTDPDDSFGWSVALDESGDTLAVGAFVEGSSAVGIDGDQADDSSFGAGAVYVLARDGAGQWSHQTYVKASNSGPGDWFGHSLALSGDGDTLAVGALGESSNATGIDGIETNNAAGFAGAVYVLARDGAGPWSQQAYVKASNTSANAFFSNSVTLSGDGSVLAVGASEDGNAIGIGGDETDASATDAGAVYVFVRDAAGQWSQRAYVKASNTNEGDGFGNRAALSGDGHTLAVGAPQEDGDATGIGGNPADDSAPEAGAVYLY